MNLWLPGGKDEGKGIVRGSGINRYRLIYLKWITSKDLLYSTENCSALCGSPKGSGVWGRMDTCICMSEPLAIHLKLDNIVNWLSSNIKEKENEGWLGGWI